MDFGGAPGGGGMDLMSWYVRNRLVLGVATLFCEWDGTDSGFQFVFL
jgi:hypothetical protein